MFIFQIFKSLKNTLVWGARSSSRSYVSYLKRKGCKVGERVFFYAPQSSYVDITRPWLIDIGDDVQITAGVTILTHGYDWAVLKKVYGEVLGSAGGVSIGNNVFIGTQSTILKGVHIGNNVIIGANSVVNHDIPDNCVAAGNPCRVIMDLEDYYHKRVALQYEEAAEMVKKYRERFGHEIDDYSLREHFWLFSDENTELHDEWKRVMTFVGNERESYRLLKEHKLSYKTKEDFLNSIK